MILYHGTDYESALSIMDNGFNNPNTVWLCSEADKTYLVEEKGDNGEALRFAFEAGQIAAANKGSTYSSVGIIRIEMSDETADEELYPDNSCENMTDCWQIDSDRLNQLADEGKVIISLGICENAYNPNLRPFYLATLSSEHYKAVDDPQLEEAIEIVSRCGDFPLEDVIGYLEVDSFDEIFKYKITA